MFKFSELIRVDDKKTKERIVYFLSFLLPFIMMICIFIAKQVFPFGDRCILRTDCYHQYLPFHTELAEKLKNFESLFYTYNVGLGTNFITLFAYYLASPLNLLLLFLVPDNFMIEYVAFVVAFKIALMGLSMSYYLVRRYESVNLVVVLFAIFYAMGGYVGAYYWNIMWLDNIILFPLLILGFEDIINGKKPYLYIITLGLSILCNYYIGTLTCIFFIFYFIFYNLLKEKGFKDIAINFVKVAIFSVVGVLISAILLVPIICAFKTTASSSITIPKNFTEYFSIIEVIGRHMPLVTIENGIDYWPNLYSGVCCISFIPLYFICKKFKLKEKICYGVLILFFIATFSINKLDFLFHAFKFPNSLPSRYSFIYTFLLLTLAIKPLLKIKSIKEKEIGIGLSISIILLIIFEKCAISVKVYYYSFYFAIIIVLLQYVVLLAYKNKKFDKNIVLYIALILVCFEAFLNMYTTSITTVKRDDYLKNTDDLKVLANRVDEMTDDFYRIERAVLKTKNDGAFIHFPSASIFSSSCYASGSEFYKKLGMEASTNAYSMTGSTPFADAILSVKYKLTEAEDIFNKDLGRRELANIGESYLYQNIYTLPFSYVFKDGFLDEYDMSSGNPATVQNNFSRTLSLGTMLDKIPMKIENTTASCTITESGDYYAFVRDKGIKEVVVNYATTAKTYKNINRGFFIELGYQKEGTDLYFENNYNQSQLLMEVFRFNYPVLKDVIDNINSNATYKMINYDTTHINYSLDVNNDGTCIVTLPYDDGFTLYIDGVKAEKKKVMDFFLGFNIGKGHHEIKLTYMPVGFLLGLLLSIIGIVSVIGIYIYDKKIYMKIIKIGPKKEPD